MVFVLIQESHWIIKNDHRPRNESLDDRFGVWIDHVRLGLFFSGLTVEEHLQLTFLDHVGSEESKLFFSDFADLEIAISRKCILPESCLFQISNCRWGLEPRFSLRCWVLLLEVLDVSNLSDDLVVKSFDLSLVEFCLLHSIDVKLKSVF